MPDIEHSHNAEWIYVYDDGDVLGRQILDVPDPAGRAALEPDRYEVYVHESEVERLRQENARLRRFVRLTASNGGTMSGEDADA